MSLLVIKIIVKTSLLTSKYINFKCAHAVWDFML